MRCVGGGVRLVGKGCWAKKEGENFINPSVREEKFWLSGMRLEEGTMVCCFDLKKSRNDWRISLLVIVNKPARRGGGNGENSRRDDEMPNTKYQPAEQLEVQSSENGAEGRRCVVVTARGSAECRQAKYMEIGEMAGLF